MKKKEQADKNIYKSPIAQSIEASGNFISRSNPVFILILVVLLGLCLLGYKYLTIQQIKVESDAPVYKKHQN